MQKLILTVLLLPFALGAAELSEIEIASSKDGAQQKALWWHPKSAPEKPVPLLVVLHTWSGNYRQKNWKEAAIKECEKRGWAMIHPDFRGPNWTPKACASEFAVQDVLDAVDWVRKQIKVDAKRIYLTGTSGGGHLSLVLAGRAPKLWAGVSAWVPISDLAQWHRDCTAAGRGYAQHMEKACGGKPGDSDQVDAEYRQRSPITHLPNAKGLPLDINAGIHDGHTGSVPATHSLVAFNVVADANGLSQKKLKAAELQHIRTQREIPEALQDEAVEKEDRLKPVLFRRSAGPARVTIFDGGHEGDMPTAIRWLAQQRKR
jgi:acetyl esterase/lipase